MTKTFSLFLMLALVLGGSLGGAFVGGVVLGKSQGQTSTEGRGAGRLSLESGRQSPRQFGGDRSDRPSREFRPGGSLEQGQERSRDRLRDRADQDSDSRRLGDQAGIVGTVERVDGDNVTVTTSRGPVTVTVGPETAIQRVVKGSLQDLKEEVRIRVRGSRNEEGNVQARAITLIPAGAEGIFGQGRSSGGRSGIVGTVERVEGDNVTVTTAQGSVTVTVGSETAIQTVVEGSLQDLKEEVRIRVRGSKDEEGNLHARAITLIPAGAEGIFGQGRRFGDRAGIFGTVEVVEGDNVTVTTRRGPVTVTVGPETAIQRVVEGSLQDLKEEVRIRVMGLRDEEGNLQATAITLVPEGSEGIFGRRGTRQER